MKLFMLSGGLDSTANLIEHVESFGNEGVIALHVEFGDAVRHFAEKQAVTSICAKYEIPCYVQRIDFIPVVDFDMLLQSSLSFHYFQIPVTEIWFGFTGKGGGFHYSRLFEYADDYMNRLNTFDMQKPIEPPTFRTAIEGKTRKELASILGGEMFWSCRQPRVNGDKFQTCGTCGTCKEFSAEGVVHPSMYVSYYSVPTRLSIQQITA